MGISIGRVNEKIEDIFKNGKYADSEIFRDFDTPDSTREIYTVWNIGIAIGFAWGYSQGGRTIVIPLSEGTNV